jgi:ABC-2 type transport system permease protein
VEEKMQRISEVLLGSVGPFQLMLGKLLGTVGVATTLAVVYLGSAFALLGTSRALGAQYYGFGDFLTLPVLAWFLAFLTLGVLMYGSLFVAIGAACTSVQETQTLLMPVMVLAMIPLFVMVQVILEPDSALATGISLIPTATPMLMVIRVAIPPGIPLWQPVVGVVLVLLTTLLLVWAAGRIFRVGILMQGKGANLGQMMKWVFRG